MTPPNTGNPKSPALTLRQLAVRLMDVADAVERGRPAPMHDVLRDARTVLSRIEPPAAT